MFLLFLFMHAFVSCINMYDRKNTGMKVPKAKKKEVSFDSFELASFSKQLQYD